MKRIFVILVLLFTFDVQGQDPFHGEQLFSTVKKYVSLGEHRTGTATDFATSEWLGSELRSVGYNVKYLEFKLKQFYPESATVKGDGKSFKAFPFWYVSDKVELDVTGAITENLTNPSGKIVLLNFKGQGGQSTKDLLKTIQELTAGGAKGIIGFAENDADEIVAFNAPKAAKAWDVPIVVVAPSHAAALKQSEGKNVALSIKGTFKDVTARNVYGTIGQGDQYVVVSTPISGWFNCGGERGPGIATWLALAKWAATQKGYTFVFTGNSGHELGGWGAHAFLDGGAPPIDKTRLWVHLGAGIATVAYESTAKGLVRQNRVDAQRGFFYSTSVKERFINAFASVEGNKYDTKVRAGGELIYVIDTGYPHVAGAAYSHPYFHMKGDDESKTSPEVLQEVALAFRNFISSEIARPLN